MVVLGIDLSSMPAGTAAVLLDGLRMVEVRERCTDEDVDGMIGRAEAVGIDAPLGWPDDFVQATGEWTLSEWNEEIRDRLRYRETDRFVHALDAGNRPLSVSSDLIALPAKREGWIHVPKVSNDRMDRPRIG